MHNLESDVSSHDQKKPSVRMKLKTASTSHELCVEISAIKLFRRDTHTHFKNRYLRSTVVQPIQKMENSSYFLTLSEQETVQLETYPSLSLSLHLNTQTEKQQIVCRRKSIKNVDVYSIMVCAYLNYKLVISTIQVNPRQLIKIENNLRNTKGILANRKITLRHKIHEIPKYYTEWNVVRSVIIKLSWPVSKNISWCPLNV